MFCQIKHILSRFNLTHDQAQLAKDLENYAIFAEMLAWDHIQAEERAA
jgi:hypothetical protein